jgi:fused signal recognition particle receptor
MEELAKIDRVLEREAPGCSRETLLVLDATTGQNGLNQAREFAAACGVTGIILTKLDGTAKGGVAIAIRDQLGLSIKFVGTGESIGDLTPFCAAEFARALLLDEEEA